MRTDTRIGKKRIPIQNRKRMAVQATMLKFLYAGGVLTTAIVAPKLLRLIDSPHGSKTVRSALYKRITGARNRLKQRGLIYEENRAGKTYLHLTESGVRSIERILAREYRIPEPVRWDGKWRMLIFDIREKRREVRNQLRRLLSSAGFVRLQDSVWVYPYSCDEFVEIVRAHLSSGVGEMRSFVVEALESDKWLREHFNLG